VRRDYKIIAVDFDGTLCTDEFPKIGNPNRSLINLLISRKEAGDKVILWTCRVGERLQEAVSWCSQSGLEFDTVNENLPEVIERFGQDTRKIHADIYIDDKAVNETSADFV
jgi:Predicted hydrolases of the HAD superfamily